MKLYYAPGACSLAPHIVLREAGLAFNLEQVDLATKKTKRGDDFMAVNPKGQVPVLQLDDGATLTEVPAIVQYLADRNPTSGLAPANGTPDRYRLQEWLNYITSEVHKSFTPLFKPNTPDAYKTIVRDNLADRFGYLDRHLADRPFIMGGRFTVADAYAFTIVGWSKYMKIDLAPWPNLRAYMDRIASRPKVQEAMRAEGLIAEPASRAAE